MALHGALRGDHFDPESVVDGDFESVREVLRKVLQSLQVSTLAPSQGGEDIFENVVHKDGDIYATNPDDPSNPTLIPIGGSSLTAGTYIDIAGDTVNVDLTEASGYNAGQNQYLKNEAGTIKWVTVSTECVIP
jgi:hypothetical protein